MCVVLVEIGPVDDKVPSYQSRLTHVELREIFDKCANYNGGKGGEDTAVRQKRALSAPCVVVDAVALPPLPEEPC